MGWAGSASEASGAVEMAAGAGGRTATATAASSQGNGANRGEINER